VLDARPRRQFRPRFTQKNGNEFPLWREPRAPALPEETVELVRSGAAAPASAGVGPGLNICALGFDSCGCSLPSYSDGYGSGFAKTLLKLIVSIKNIACCANCALFKPIAPTIPDRPAKRYCGHCLWERIERQLLPGSAERDLAVSQLLTLGLHQRLIEARGLTNIPTNSWAGKSWAGKRMGGLSSGDAGRLGVWALDRRSGIRWR
jgi:hypothetical protein